jgi:hypothetical protein
MATLSVVANAAGVLSLLVLVAFVIRSSLWGEPDKVSS